MHLIETVIDKAKMARPFHGVEFEAEDVTAADRLEIWGSSFKDPGPDWCEFRLLVGNDVIASHKLKGY